MRSASFFYCAKPSTPPELRAVSTEFARQPSLAWQGRGYSVALTQLVDLETIAFAAGECVGYHEQFASGATGDGAYVCQLQHRPRLCTTRRWGPRRTEQIATSRLA